ncbi:MAG: beta-propeller fold lactonase family protein [Terracidiphilus sp.]|nr:beta-propeller fold lactonase family protein [Terracidiphilus sp.]
MHGKLISIHAKGGSLGRLSAACLLLVSLAACRRHDFPQYSPNYREYAYVTNGAGNTVSIYDVVNLRLDRELPVGINPVAVTASVRRNEVYVINQGVPGTLGSVTVINAENNSVAAAIPVHRQPAALALAPEGDLVYVANTASNNVSVLDMKDRREVFAIGTGEEPVAVRVSPDGKTLVVANRRGNSVSLIDLSGRPQDQTVRSVISGCPGASDVAILPDSSKAFVACSEGHQILAISLAHPAGKPAPADAAQPDRVEALLDVGHQPAQLALKPDGGEIFVVNAQSDSISEVITGTDDVQGAYLIGANPAHGIVSADNAYVYVSNGRSQEVGVYAIDDGKRLGSIRVGDGPSALAFSAAGHLLFVVDARSNDVAVVRTSSRSLFTLLPAGRGPNAIAVKAFKLP